MPEEKKRATDRLLVGKTKDRVEKQRDKKMRGDFFSRGAMTATVYCRLCGEVIVDRGRLCSNYRNVEFEYEGGGMHRTNCCRTCAPAVAADPEAVFCSDVESWARTAEVVEGMSAEKHEERMKAIHARALKADAGRVVEFKFVQKD